MRVLNYFRSCDPTQLVLFDQSRCAKPTNIKYQFKVENPQTLFRNEPKCVQRVLGVPQALGRCYFSLQSTSMPGSFHPSWILSVKLLVIIRNSTFINDR